MMQIKSIAAAAALAASASPVLAVAVPGGTATFVALFNPMVDLTSSPSTAAFNGPTFQISSLGGFGGASGLNGTMTGTIDFSSMPGVTLAQSLANFLTFNDGQGGLFSFSLQSVLTQSYIPDPGVTQSFSLYLLGTIADTSLGYTPTATSLTLGFNQTAGSGYAASGTLAVLPPGMVPEPATWAMFIAGFGAVGFAMRRRRRTAVAFGRA